MFELLFLGFYLGLFKMFWTLVKGFEKN